MLLVVYILAYVFWYVLASAAIDGIAASELLPELVRNPILLIKPDLYGNSASQLLAVYNAAATVVLFAYLAMRRRRVQRVPSAAVSRQASVVPPAVTEREAITETVAEHEANSRSPLAADPTVAADSAAVAEKDVSAHKSSASRAQDADRSTLMGLSAVSAGLLMLLAGWAWTEYSLIADWKAMSTALAATLIAMVLWYRFWHFTTNGAGESLRQMADHGFMSGVLTFHNGLFALCALLTLCVVISRPFGMMGAYVAVLGVPLALLSYVALEIWMLVLRGHRSRTPRLRPQV